MKKTDNEEPEFGPAPTMEQYEIATRAAFDAYLNACKAHGITLPHAMAITLAYGAACAPPEEWTALEDDDRPQVANFTTGCRASAHQALAFLVSGLVETGRLDAYGSVAREEDETTDAIEAAVSGPTGKVWH